MVSDHVDGLLSAAYDGVLSVDERAGFDRHLAECPACAAAFTALTTAVDALRELEPARMPRPVRLPEGSPIPERRFAGLPVRLPRGGRFVTGLTAAGVVAAAGVAAAVVITGHFLPGGTVSSGRSYSAMSGGSAMQGAVASGPASAAAGPANPAACAVSGCSTLAPSTSACLPEPLAISADSAADVPAGFSNRDINDDGITKVVIASQASSFAPGETVDIYARLIDDGTGAVYLPCTVLEGPQEVSPNSALTVPGGKTRASATPVGRITVDGQPVLQVVVPLSATSGETFQIVVEVPASAGEARSHTVSLSIQVT
jgi:hypothetical protein